LSTFDCNIKVDDFKVLLKRNQIKIGNLALKLLLIWISQDI